MTQEDFEAKYLNQMKLKKRLHCRKCDYVWEYKGKTTRTNCPLCGAFKETRNRKTKARTAELKQWLSQNGNKRKHSDSWNKRIKRACLVIISKSACPKCKRCGCDDIRLLEINHKNGGGKKDFESGKYAREFYMKIYRLERATDDLEVLCKVCNAWHALELKFGRLPFSVQWIDDGIQV